MIAVATLAWLLLRKKKMKRTQAAQLHSYEESVAMKGTPPGATATPHAYQDATQQEAVSELPHERLRHELH